MQGLILFGETGEKEKKGNRKERCEMRTLKVAGRRVIFWSRYVWVCV